MANAKVTSKFKVGDVVFASYISTVNCERGIRILGPSKITKMELESTKTCEGWDCMIYYHTASLPHMYDESQLSATLEEALAVADKLKNPCVPNL